MAAKRIVTAESTKLSRSTLGDMLIEVTTPAQASGQIQARPEGWRSGPERNPARLERTPLARAKRGSTAVNARSDASRLKSNVLVEFLVRPADAKISVILEASRLPVSSSVVRATKLLGVAAIPKAAKANLRRQQEAVASKPQTGALKAQLKHLGLASKARLLKASGAFVVEVSPGELRRLAEAPSVQAIRPNRTGRR